jgi:hypothetical protein
MRNQPYQALLNHQKTPQNNAIEPQTSPPNQKESLQSALDDDLALSASSKSVFDKTTVVSERLQAKRPPDVVSVLTDWIINEP